MLDDVRSAVAALTATLETASDSAEVLDAVCSEAVRVVPGADMASITAIDERGARTAAYSDKRAYEVDQAQYAAGDGPCLRAAATGETVRLSLYNASELWPDFAASAKQVGVGSYLAAPLRVDDRLAGAINLFGFGDHGFAEMDSKLLDLYVTVVTFGLRTIHRYQQVRELADNLETAMRSRAVIEQAKGILMATYKISDDAAIQRLISYSQGTNTKLRQIAAEFVRKASIPDEE
ncbi:GAF and ANTAR domain-containing protein [Kibdelosporangium philippinense]|uniref:GAF and ANTAR domain-containing protein n=1 Tax=Kibdelosporangium philippinense TaxID=211113 RepID=A0ABS8ZSY2_9PSEU|nr:GAF and ANTAR domain-containing protein [Kibdelosporangium philippinense]MCE7010838.1 GAF and ANTAR domain-containing protein [Kibdelosporangium philippinense]